MPIYRLNSGGSWKKLSALYRLNSSGVWKKLSNIYRLNSNGIWKKIFSSSADPAPKSDVNLWFIESPYNSSSNKSTTADSSSDAAWQDSRMYVQRGKWLNDPLYFETRIQKKNSGGTWGLVNPPGINDSQFTYLTGQEYSDSDFEEIWPSSTNWPSVSLEDIKNKAVFRAKFRVSQSLDPSEEELSLLEFHFPSDSGIAPRLKFSFNPFSGVGFYGELVEYTEFSSPGNKVLAIKWRYTTSLLPENEFQNLIGKQVIEVVNQNGTRVLGPFDAEVQPSNPQFYVFNYTQAMIDSGDDYTIKLYSIANDYYYNSSNSLEQHMSDSSQTRQLATMLWTPSQVPLPLGGASITGTIKEGSEITLNAGNWEEGSCDITNYHYYIEVYDTMLGEYVVANSGSAYISSASTTATYTIPETHIEDNGTDQIRLAVYAENCAGQSETPNTTSDYTVLPFTKTFYKGRSVCNAEQGCYIIEPYYTGETAEYVPGEEPADIVTGTINQREKIVWRENEEWAIVAAANESCVECGTHIITATAGLGGSINPSGEIQVQTFDDLTFTIIPDSGYNILNVVVDGISYGTITSYTFENITEDHTISATFSQKVYYCAEREQDGTANYYTSTSDLTSTCIACNEGTDASFYPNPPACNGCTCCPQTTECVPVYTITATAGSNGSISPSGSISVNKGANQSFTITANSGYEVIDVLIDGISYGSLTSYTFTNVQSDHTISASFAQSVFFCTAREADGTTNNYISENDESSQCIACNPGTSGSANYPEAPECNGCVCCEFSEECVPTFTITATAGTGGTISPSGSIEVQQGNQQSFTITPNSGYSILNVLIDGVSYGTISSYTFTNVQSDHTISVSFSVTTWYCTAREQDGSTNNYTSTSDESSTCVSCSTSWYPTAPNCNGCTCCPSNTNECSCTVTKNCTPYVYTYGEWSAWGACTGCERNRFRSYTATRTCSGTNADCTTYSNQQETISGNQYDTPQNCCCAVIENCTDWTYSYGEWSACDANNNKSRTYTRTKTCSGTNSDCTTYSNVVVTENGTQTEACPVTWYCTTSVNSNCAGCTYSIETSNISQSGSGYSIACSTSAYPNCQTPCTQWWCKTTNAETGYCALSGPYTSDQTGNSGLFRTVCSTGTSNPYTCQSQPPFFPPHFPPFFPPFFPPHFPPFFPPHFPPFFPPFFPPHFPPFFPPHFPPFFPPFFPPHFPPFFPPFFPPHFPPFFPPFFPPYFPACLPTGSQAGCECNGGWWTSERCVL